MSAKNRIGIIGGGQLGRMMTVEALRMGFTVTVVDPTPNCPAAQVGAKQILAALTDEEAAKRLAKESDFLTFEIEHINTQVLIDLRKKGVKINPSPETLETIKDKLKQKIFLKDAGIPVAPFMEIKDEESILKAAKEFGYPMILKTRFGGYDGRGNAVVKNAKSIQPALELFGDKPVYVEKNVDFIKELAVMVARSLSGEIVLYPVVETIHKNNICHTVLAPAPINPKSRKQAEKLAIKTMEKLGGGGVFGVEMFLTSAGKVVVNEIAPRVHNSGHYTTEACITSQFEQHIRAIVGLPLGEAEMVVPASVMVNILGDRKGNAEVTGLDKSLKVPRASIHIYGKAETKPERKMGHVTVTAKSLTTARKNAKLARERISI